MELADALEILERIDTHCSCCNVRDKCTLNQDNICVFDTAVKTCTNAIKDYKETTND